MVARRKTYRRRRPRKTSWYNRKYSTLDLAKKAWYATKYLKGLVNSERMYLDTAIFSNSVKHSVTLLNGLPVGDVAGTRTGNSILMRSLYMRGFIQIHPSVTVNTRVSLALVYDTQQVADTVPGTSTIFTSTDPEAQLITSSTGYNAGRFKIMMRKNYNLIPSQKPTIQIDKYFKLYKHAKYNGINATDIQKNGLYLVLLTSESTNNVTFSLNSRIGYHDN